VAQFRWLWLVIFCAATRVVLIWRPALWSEAAGSSVIPPRETYLMFGGSFLPEAQYVNIRRHTLAPLLAMCCWKWAGDDSQANVLWELRRRKGGN
jgi:hypothetical protein